MKKLKKIFIIIILLFIIVILSVNQKIFASTTMDAFQKMEYSEDFKKWLELPDEEKKNVLMPRIYEIKDTSLVSKNPATIAKFLKASINPTYNLKNVIPSNLAIRNQQQTNSCWAFAALSSLETNLALYNHKNGINLSKVYDFSERHMEYATSKTFANNVENKIGYNRKVGDGGNYQISGSYLTNGTGAIPESELPFENNEDTIDISKIQNKTVSSQVYDTIEFPDYQRATGEERTQIMNKIKQHIQNYGSVQASIHGNSSSSSAFSCYNNTTGAKFCNSSIMHSIDHAVSIIGWNDNYSVDNFAENAKPESNGAWIVRNSWGERVEYKLSELKQAIFDAYKQQEWNSAQDVPNSFIEEAGYTIENDIAYIKYGDNGLIYISYEDVNISKSLCGIEKAADSVDYDYLYQYDEFFPVMQLSLTSPNMMLCNIFNKKTTGTEYLTQISLYAPETYTCKVYVNPNGTGKSKSDLQQVTLKEGESETFSAGYHTLEFSKPVELKANSFAVMVEIQSADGSALLPLESVVDDVDTWNSVSVENGKCFVAIGNNLENCEWNDLGKLKDQNPSLINGDSSIKAYTTTELLDGSLKNIEIATPPNKTSYFEKQDFDKTGMVVKANYNRKENPSVTLDSTSYNITNGTNLKAGQTSVTITYEGKSVNQTISVEKDSIVELKIKTPPTKIEYKEGQHFDKTGMVIEATYKSGKTETISDYTLVNGNNLKANQTEVTIKYGEQSISQSVTVIPNPLIELNVTKEPNKTKYIVGQNFDTTGMIVTGTFQDNSNIEILDYTIEDGTNLTKEQTAVTIQYEGKSTTQAITVEEKSIIGIVVNKAPTKTTYIQNKEELDLAGGSITVNYNDNSNEEIDLTSEQVQVSGFDNTKLGKNTITITYQSYTTTFDVEIIAEETAKNSNFDKINCNINSAKYYTFSNTDTQEYLLLDVTVNGIVKNTENDSYEYYYYLSSNPNENNIENWVEIKDKQISNNELQFTINTKDIKNYEELSGADALYLYVKETVTKGGDQSVAISKAMKMDSDITIEIYLDNAKVTNVFSGNVNNTNSSNGDNTGDTTTAQNILPKTGITTILILLLIGSLFGIVVYIKYKNLSKYIK